MTSLQALQTSLTLLVNLNCADFYIYYNKFASNSELVDELKNYYTVKQNLIWRFVMEKDFQDFVRQYFEVGL